jgi:hypothetical protein
VGDATGVGSGQGDAFGVGDGTGAGEAEGDGTGEGTGEAEGDGTGEGTGEAEGDGTGVRAGAGRRCEEKAAARGLGAWWCPVSAASATPVAEMTRTAAGNPTHDTRLRNTLMLTSSPGRLATPAAAVSTCAEPEWLHRAQPYRRRAGVRSGWPGPQ